MSQKAPAWNNSQSISSFSSPVWAAHKKINSTRKQKWSVVIDYRKLITIDDKYPLSNISDLLE